MLPVIIGGALAFYGLGAVAQSEKPNLKEGAWRIAIQMTVPNATGPETGPMQYDRCLSPGNAKTLLAMPASAPCILEDSMLIRDALTWRMSCSQEGYKSAVNGKINFRGEVLDGEIITSATGPQNIRISTRIAGRYTGKCVNIKEAPRPRSGGSSLPKYKE